MSGSGFADASTFDLRRDAFGRLRLRLHGDVNPEPSTVVPVRAFPLTVLGGCIALVGPDGRELAWIEQLDDLESSARALIEEALALRDFMPEIAQVISVSSFATPSTWEVRTDRGPTVLTLKSEDDLRRLEGNGYLVSGADGVQFRIRDRLALDRASRKLLDRFL